jgi:ribosomal biogenesis protein LAS1
MEGIDSVREKVQAILKTYVKERKNEIKSRKKDDRAAQHALSTYTLRYAPSSTSIPPQRTQAVLLNLLITDKMILPADKKLGSNMSGAFLIWDPVLRAFAESKILPVTTTLTQLWAAMNGPRNPMVGVESDPIKEGMYEWILHMFRSEGFPKPSGLVEDILAKCFSDPTYWNIRVAEALVRDEELEVKNREAWKAILQAAKSEGIKGAADGDVEMEVDVEKIEMAKPAEVKEQIQGPMKVVGMWKRRPIGWMMEEGEDDE